MSSSTSNAPSGQEISSRAGVCSQAATSQTSASQRGPHSSRGSVVLPRPPAAGAVLIDPDVDQRRALEAGRTGDVLMIGGPGTGKTATLVRGVWERVQAGTPLSRMVVLTHTRPAAQALRTQIVRALGGAEVAPAVMTPHALAHGLLRRFGEPRADGRDLTLLSAPEQEFRVRELLRHADTEFWPDDLVAAATTRGFATEVRTACARVRQLGLDPMDVHRLAEESGRGQWQMLASFHEEYLDVLDSEGLIDYAELVHRARLLLAVPEVAESWRSEIEQVWCDDMGEFDPSQVQLVADLARSGATVFGAADPWTGVFGFRGADDRIVLDFNHVFQQAGRVAPERVALSTNHRNARAVAEVIQTSAHRLPRPGVFNPGVVPDQAAAGSVEILVTDSPGAEAEHLAQVLRSARLDGGLDWSQMAVVTRSAHGTLPLLARSLSSHGVPVQLAGDEVALAEAMAVVPLVTALRLTLDEPAHWSLDVALDLLRSPLGGLHGLGLRRLARHLRASQRNAAAHSGVDAQSDIAGEADVAGEADDQEIEAGAAGQLAADRLEGVVDPLSSGQWCLTLLQQPELLLPVDDTAEVEATRALGRLLHQARHLVEQQATAAEVLWLLWSATTWPQRLQHEALSNGESAPRANRDLDAICALFDVANAQLDWTGERGVRALLTEVAAQQIPADHARESDPRERGVTLTTAHRVKGTSWPLVVVAGLQEGIWPATRRRSSLLDSGRLTATGLGEVEPFSSMIAAERRLFVLAASRASDRLVLSCVSGTEGEADQPSRFLDELGQPTRLLGRPTRPLTVSGAVAELRRTATDPTASEALRRAAATRLARMSRENDHQNRPLAPDADPARWWGIVDYTAPAAPLISPQAPVRLAGSELEQVLSCPRRWFLSRQAHAEQQRGSASSLGSVIHVLVDHANTDGTDLDTLQGHLDQIWDQIPFDAAWLSSSERSEAEAALERYVTWEGQQRRTVVGTEVTFDVTVDLGDESVNLRGTVDRLELDEFGRVHVVDFKTGRSMPTKAEAERSPQLGLYQLATQLGAFEELTGSTQPGGAELVYLRQGLASGAPKVLTQPSLHDHPHLDEPTDSLNWMIDAVSEAVATIRAERFDARAHPGCQHCPFAASCPAKAIAVEVGR